MEQAELQPQGDAILRMEGIVKRYGDLVANDNIDLSLRHGEILAVIGENGAGKTTLFKVLYGLERANAGRVYYKGKEVQFKNPADAIECGIGMVQQHFMLFEPFTVAENVVYGKEPRRGIFFDLKKANDQIKELSLKYHLPLDPRRRIQGMPVGLRQRVEILKVLYQNAEVIVFDEPTAVLTPQEVHDLLNTLKQLASMGKSVIIVTHKLNEVMEVADRAIVLRAGKLVADKLICDTSIEELSFLMVGRHLQESQIPAVAPGRTVLEVKDLVLAGKEAAPVLDGVSLTVREGEIVGIAGVSGNGQSELVQCIFGLAKADKGGVLVAGKNVFNRPVRFVRDAGAALIPEDRYLWGSASEATISETAIMAHYRDIKYSRRGVLKARSIRQFAEGIVKQFSIKTDDVSLKTKSLSGGNAQKLIAAREIVQYTPLLIACEPTRGVDIGAMEFIHDKLIKKRDSGGGVLLVSSELTEIMKLSDRIYVMFSGRINGEFERGKVSEEQLGLLMAGGVKQ